MNRIENQKCQGRISKHLQGKGGKKAVTKVTTTNEGVIEEFITQDDIVRVCAESNLRRQLKSIGTPFLTAPLLEEVGYDGSGEAVELILEGTFTPPSGTDKYACELIKEMERPGRVEDIVIHITRENHQQAWKKQNANTACEPSQLNFHHYKGGSSNNKIALLDARMREIPMLLGFSPVTWQRITDVEILKKLLIYDVDSMRLIQLMEAQFNMNNKFIGKLAMAAAEKNHTIADDQCGSRKNRRSAVAALNKRLTMDMWRQRKQSGAISMNSAEGCFD